MFRTAQRQPAELLYSYKLSVYTLGLVYALVALVACAILLGLDLDVADLWVTFVSYRMIFMSLSVLMLAVSVYDAGRARVGMSGPVLGIALNAVYALWLTVVLIFIAIDWTDCAATPHCASVGDPTKPDGYFIAWFISTILLLILSVVMAALLLRIRSFIGRFNTRACQQVSQTGLVAQQGFVQPQTFAQPGFAQPVRPGFGFGQTVQPSFGGTLIGSEMGRAPDALKMAIDGFDLTIEEDIDLGKMA